MRNSLGDPTRNQKESVHNHPTEFYNARRPERAFRFDINLIIPCLPRKKRNSCKQRKEKNTAICSTGRNMQTRYFVYDTETPMASALMISVYVIWYIAFAFRKRGGGGEREK